MTSDSTEMTNLNETEKKNSLAQLDLGKLKAITEFSDLGMKTAERAGKWPQKTLAAGLGLGVSLLGGVGIAMNLPLPNELKLVVVGASGLSGMCGAALIVGEIDERRKRMDEERKKIENHQRIEEVRASRTILLDTLGKYPKLEPLLLQPIKDNFQTETILLRADSTGAIQVLPLSNDLPSHPQQNILPPAPETENPT